MSLTVGMITVDCTDPERLAGWWAGVVGGSATALMPGEFVVVSTAAGPVLGFQRVDEPTPGKNRLHLDLTAAGDLDTEVARLVDLGATETARHSIGGYGWVVFADPDGNAFCVAPAQNSPH